MLWAMPTLSPFVFAYPVTSVALVVTAIGRTLLPGVTSRMLWLAYEACLLR